MRNAMAENVRVQLGEMGRVLAGGRRAVLTAALAFALLSAAHPTASAESAWFLFELNGFENGGAPRPLGEFTAESACKAAALRAAHSLYVNDFHRRSLGVLPGTVQLDGPEVHFPIEFEWLTVSYVCHRNAVDRGPEAK